MSESQGARIMRHLLTISASAAGEALSDAGVDPKAVAFALVLWPVGEPEKCSSICGSSNPTAGSEIALALHRASVKAVDGPTSVIVNREGNA